MAAYPFQPMSMKKLKKLSRIVKEPKQNVKTKRLQKVFILPDTTHPVTDQTSNHPQTENP